MTVVMIMWTPACHAKTGVGRATCNQNHASVTINVDLTPTVVTTMMTFVAVVDKVSKNISKSINR